MLFVFVLCTLGFAAVIALYVGLKLARVIADQFDELMPQRMIDYSGFVNRTSLGD